MHVFSRHGTELLPAGRVANVGSGPLQMVQATVEGRSLLLVTAFFEHALTVIDISAPNPDAFHIVAQVKNAEVPTASRGH